MMTGGIVANDGRTILKVGSKVKVGNQIGIVQAIGPRRVIVEFPNGQFPIEPRFCGPTEAGDITL